MNNGYDGACFRVPVEEKSFSVGQKVVILDKETNPKKLHGVVGVIVSYDPKIGYAVKVPYSEVAYYGFEYSELMAVPGDQDESEKK